MEIVKSLDINKRYNKVPNGSIVMAKNMRVNEDNSALELDEGFKDVLLEAIDNYNYKYSTTLSVGPIVGIIECPKEIVLFTRRTSDGTIFRLKELNDNSVEIVPCKTVWEHSGGHINGTYTYNVKGELIVTVGEYLEDNSKDIPLRVINLDLDTTNNNIDDYNVAPNIPIANLKLINTISGPAIPTGTYYFFIRYKIYEEEYTNWFPIGIPYQALNIENKILFNHDYPTKNSAVYTKHPLNYLSVPVNNTNKDCNFNFVFKLTTSPTNFTEAQIGYILQHGSSTVARYYKDINISTDSEFVFNGKFTEEADLANFIENPLPLYNVHCIANFENRNYIANYKEENDKYDSALASASRNISIEGIKGNSISRWGSSRLANPNDFLNLNSIYTIRDARTEEDEEEIPTTEQTIEFAANNATFIKDTSFDGVYYQIVARTRADIAFGRNNVAIRHLANTSSLVNNNLINKDCFLITAANLDENVGYGEESRVIGNIIGGEAPHHCLVFPPYDRDVDVTIEIKSVGAGGDIPDTNITSVSTNNVRTSLVSNTNITGSDHKLHKLVIHIEKAVGTPTDINPLYASFFFDYGSYNKETYIRDISIYSETTVKRTDITSNSTQPNSSSKIKSDFTFSYPNSKSSISLYDLSGKDYIKWAFGEEATENLYSTDTVSIGSYGTKAIKDVYLWLGEQPYINGIDRNVDLCFYVEGSGRTQYFYASEFTLYTNNKQFKSIIHKWGAPVIRDMGTPSYTTSNMDVVDEGTFDPEESYKFYIHYVRNNGTYTKGYPINGTLPFQKEFGLYKWYPRFSGITVSAPFIGYFITYKQITNRRVFTGTLVSPRDTDTASDKQEQRNWLRVRATDVEIGLNNYQGDYAVLEFDDGRAIGNSAIQTSLLELDRSKTHIMIGNVYDQDDNNGTIGEPGSIRLGLKSTISGTTIFDGYSTGRHAVSVFNENPRSSTSTTYDDLFELSHLGPIIYNTGNNLTFVALPTNSYDIHYPSRIVKEKTYYFNRPIYFNPESVLPKYYDFNTLNDFEYFTLKDIPADYLEVYEYYKYSRINLNAIEIKSNPTELIISGSIPEYMISETVTIDSILKTSDVYAKITYVEPQNSHDIFRFPSEYFINNYKLYYEAKENDNTVVHFTKSIRRSNILADESSEVSLRNFNATQYKVISSNKGNITALVALGTDLLIHTENTLFRLSKQAILEADSRSVDVTAGDLFSVDPQEIFTANHGYGGLQVENNWCTNEHGYWFYDRDNHKLFNLDNGQLNDISEPIVKYLNTIYPEDVRFNTDFKNHRVFICFKEDNSTEHNPVTFSFNVITKSFISIHDFKFGIRCNTKNNVYFLGDVTNQYKTNNYDVVEIFKFDSYKYRGYISLTSVSSKFPTFVDDDWSNEQIPSYIDIIFNNQYPIIRNLESINYLLGYKEEFDDFDYKLFEDREKYSGNYIEIYTDSTDSRILDLSQGTEVNNYNDYKHPHYNKGSWQFNYFRNIVSKELTPTQLNDYIARLGLTESALPYIINGVTDNDNPSQIDQVIRPSDERSLIYGKYIIVRFIFTNTNDKQIRFEDVNVNVNSY